MRRRPVLLAAAASLAACSTPPPRVYTLRSVPGPVLSGTPPGLLMRTVQLPKYLDRPQIVRSDGQVGLTLYELDRWGEPLADLTTRVLGSNLASRMPGTAVLSETSVAAPSAAFLLEVTLTRFDAEPDGTVLLYGQFAILPPGSGAVPLLRQVRIPEPAPANDPAALATSMGTALGRLADAIAETLTVPAAAVSAAPTPAPPVGTRSSRRSAAARR